MEESRSSMPSAMPLNSIPRYRAVLSAVPQERGIRCRCSAAHNPVLVLRMRALHFPGKRRADNRHNASPQEPGPAPLTPGARPRARQPLGGGAGRTDAGRAGAVRIGGRTNAIRSHRRGRQTDRHTAGIRSDRQAGPGRLAGGASARVTAQQVAHQSNPMSLRRPALTANVVQ
jgi:hypothetical protein